MKKFVAQLNDGSYINCFADRMEIKDNLILVWWEDDLVVALDISAAIVARIDLVDPEKR